MESAGVARRVDRPAAVVARSSWRWVGRAILALAGLTVVAVLLRSAGPGRVFHVLRGAGPWMPWIGALELVQVLSDIVALRLILGDLAARIPYATWIRSSAVSYAMMVLLPAGRAAGEVARGALFAKHIGVTSATSCATQLQASYVSAIGVLSFVEFWTVASLPGPRSSLALLLAINAAITVVGAAALVAILWDARVGRWLAALRSRVSRAKEPASLAPLARRIPWPAACACTVGRSAQAAQYALILSAVGGIATVRSALVVHGVHLVGATLGDAVPGQLGVLDGIYRAFAAVIGFASEPERALSIAFVAHATQLVLAAVCVVVATVTGRGAGREAAR
jgi:lysylphosphatidylglycerol synthase-like protein